MKLILDTPSYSDIEEVVTQLDDLDVLEWYFASGPDIRGSVQHAVLQSQGKCRVARLDDDDQTPVGLFGVVSSGLADGHPWAVMTPAARRYPKAVMENAKTWVSICRGLFDFLHIRVWADHKPARRFIEQLGFVLDRYEIATPPSGADFAHYFMNTEEV